MKIWVYLNDIQQGPYTLEELSQLPVTASTPVWYDGLPQWLPAGEAPETAALFESAGSQADAASNDSAKPAETLHLQQTVSATDVPPCPPTFVGWSIFVLICCFPIGGVLGLIFSSLTGNAYDSGNYEKAVRMSEYAEWTIILSIVMGLVMAPLVPFLL